MCVKSVSDVSHLKRPKKFGHFDTYLDLASFGQIGHDLQLSGCAFDVGKMGGKTGEYGDYGGGKACSDGLFSGLILGTFKM